MSDIIEQLKDIAGGDWSDSLVHIPMAMMQAADILEQYRADHKSDEQTNNELRADRDALVKALEEIIDADTCVSDGGKVHDHGPFAGIAMKALAGIVGGSR